MTFVPLRREPMPADCVLRSSWRVCSDAHHQQVANILGGRVACSELRTRQRWLRRLHSLEPSISTDHCRMRKKD